MVPIADTYEMNRQIKRPIDFDILQQNRTGNFDIILFLKGQGSVTYLTPNEYLDDANFTAPPPPVLNPIRVRFARNETEWQRKRREQSFQVCPIEYFFILMCLFNVYA